MRFGCTRTPHFGCTLVARPLATLHAPWLRVCASVAALWLRARATLFRFMLPLSVQKPKLPPEGCIARHISEEIIPHPGNRGDVLLALLLLQARDLLIGAEDPRGPQTLNFLENLKNPPFQGAPLKRGPYRAACCGSVPPSKKPGAFLVVPWGAPMPLKPLN